MLTTKTGNGICANDYNISTCVTHKRQLIVK